MSLVEIVSDLKQLPTEEIKSRLSNALLKTAEGMAEMAACVRELEERGEDLSSIRLAIMPYLRRIAHGQLLPQIVVSYAGSPRLLAAVSSLPLPDQERLISTGRVQVAVVESDGAIGSRDIDPMALSINQISRVFSPEGIVPPSEQQAKPRKSRESRRKYSVRVDKGRHVLIVGRMVVPITEVLDVMSRAGGWQGELDKSHVGNMPTAAAKLTDEEKERLKALSRATDTPEYELVRRAILTWLV